jgi:hypothetical protein
LKNPFMWPAARASWKMCFPACPSTCKYLCAWQTFRVYEPLFDWSVQPRNCAKVVEMIVAAMVDLGVHRS